LCHVMNPGRSLKRINNKQARQIYIFCISIFPEGFSELNHRGNFFSGEGQKMVAYKFYWNDETEVSHTIGILPERRKDVMRITPESIMNWGRMVIGESAGVNLNNIYFVQIEV
jgi:hypothetical protein